jgi:hypothetical protein
MSERLRRFSTSSEDSISEELWGAYSPSDSPRDQGISPRTARYYLETFDPTSRMYVAPAGQPDSPELPNFDSPESPSFDYPESLPDSLESLPDSPESPIPDSPESLPDSPESPIPDSPESLPDSPESPIPDSPESPLPDSPESPVPDSPESPLPDSPESPNPDSLALPGPEEFRFRRRQRPIPQLALLPISNMAEHSLRWAEWNNSQTIPSLWSTEGQEIARRFQLFPTNTPLTDRQKLLIAWKTYRSGDKPKRQIMNLYGRPEPDPALDKDEKLIFRFRNFPPKR